MVPWTWLPALIFRSSVDDPSPSTPPESALGWRDAISHQSVEPDVSGGITTAGEVNLRRALWQAATGMMHRERSTWLRTCRPLPWRQARLVGRGVMADRIQLPGQSAHVRVV